MTLRRDHWRKFSALALAAGLCLVVWLVVWGPSSRAQEMTAPRQALESTSGPDPVTWGASAAIAGTLSDPGAHPLGVQFPRLVFGADHRAYATWEGVHDRGVSPYTSTIFLSRRAPGGGWSTPGVVSETLDTSSQHAELAVDVSSDVHVVWHEIVSRTLGYSDYRVFYARVLSTTGEVAAFRELAQLSDVPPAPVIALNGSQEVHVTWQDGRPVNIYHRHSLDGGNTWLTTTQVIDRPSSSDSAALAVDSGGKLHIVWKEELGPGYAGAVLYRIATPTGDSMSWGNVITASGDITGCVKPSIVVSGTDAFVGWGKQLGNQKVQPYVARCQAGACDAPSTIGRPVVVNTSDPSLASPVLAAGPGVVGAVWHGDQEHEEPGPDTKEEILFTYSTDGGQTWTPATNVSKTPDERSLDPDLAFDGGLAHVVWRERYQESPQRYEVRYTHSDVARLHMPVAMRNYRSLPYKQYLPLVLSQ